MALARSRWASNSECPLFKPPNLQRHGNELASKLLPFNRNLEPGGNVARASGEEALWIVPVEID